MSKILAISPISIAGALIIKGFVKAFSDLGHKVLLYDVRELNFSEILEFSPDFVFGYDYLHFVREDVQKFIESLQIPVIHYFADAPDSDFSLSGDISLVEKLQNSDNIVFCWDKNYLNFFKPKSYYLPLAVEPDLYDSKNNNLADIPEIAFVGRPLTDVRIDLLVKIIQNFPDKLGIYSYKKHFDKSVDIIRGNNLLNEEQLGYYVSCYKGFLETESELAEVYSKAKILLNITLEQGVNSMNYRVFEVLASNGFLLTDYKSDTAEYFEDRKHLVFYNSAEHLINLINEFLNNDILRKEIALNGRNKVLECHTFKQRAMFIMDKITALN